MMREAVSEVICLMQHALLLNPGLDKGEKNHSIRSLPPSFIGHQRPRIAGQGGGGVHPVVEGVPAHPTWHQGGSRDQCLC